MPEQLLPFAHELRFRSAAYDEVALTVARTETRFEPVEALLLKRRLLPSFAQLVHLTRLYYKASSIAHLVCIFPHVGAESKEQMLYALASFLCQTILTLPRLPGATSRCVPRRVHVHVRRTAASACKGEATTAKSR